MRCTAEIPLLQAGSPGDASVIYREQSALDTEWLPRTGSPSAFISHPFVFPSASLVVPLTVPPGHQPGGRVGSGVSITCVLDFESYLQEIQDKIILPQNS